MTYEKHVRSFIALRKELGQLDGDAGVRVEGRCGYRKCFAFVTRFGKTYTAMVYSAKRRTARPPGSKLAWKEFTDLDDVMAFLTSLATPRVDAYVY